MIDVVRTLKGSTHHPALIFAVRLQGTPSIGQRITKGK